MTIKVGSRKSRLALKQVEIVMNCLEIDDYEVIKFSTEGDKKSAMGYSQFDKLNFVEDIESKLLLKEIDKEDSLNDEFAVYGMIMENNLPGIKYHSIGVNGASVPSYLRSVSFTNQLQTIAPDLAILSIGINDAYETNFSKEKFKNNYDSLIQKIRISNPSVSILFTTNNDSYYKRKYPNKNAFLVAI